MQVVEQVMRGMRRPDEPYRNHGAATAVRYCSPTNGASSLTPEAFAGYLREPWYLTWLGLELGLGLGLGFGLGLGLGVA